jgi:hypothetical protein
MSREPTPLHSPEPPAIAAHAKRAAAYQLLAEAEALEAAALRAAQHATAQRMRHGADAHEWVTVAEAARRLGRDPSTVRRWVRGGSVACRRLGPHTTWIDSSQLGRLAEGER